MADIADALEREQAISVTDSYCVSAPAGSGKTELLIQRYLALLPRVARPEQVLAITFTRKAAAEMRERVMAALRDAASGTHCDSAHQMRTRELAEAALKADEERGWHLLRDISRFNIKTIDSFCAGLTRQMPVLSTFGGQANPVDDSTPLYEAAVNELFARIDSDDAVAADLKAVLLTFDNNWARLKELLVSMLMRRDQWRAYMGVHESADESESYLINVVQDIVRETLAELAAAFADYSAEVHELHAFSARNLESEIPVSFPGSEPGDLPAWRAVRKLLLTDKGDWRKKVDKRQGFPAGTGGDSQVYKDRIHALLEHLGQDPALGAQLNNVATLPEMSAGSEAWQLVVHLSRLLPRLAASLLLVFRREGSVDHNQVAHSALLALGDEDAPTDLALRLDYSIEHLLVDEFQDTSINQYELLEKLTRGWAEHNALTPDAPRTLMIVGDAMQSIYGFRNANVGLFLKARSEGFNGVVPTHLELKSNFRSHAGVVDWVNATFASAFPPSDDIGAGRVRYSPAIAVRDEGPAPAISLDAYRGEDAQLREAEAICDCIAACVADGETDIAVLGRLRRHLEPITSRLKALGIAYQAQDLDSLAASPTVVDLMSLCQVLAGDEDRLAFLALLRAPWCGLRLADLHAIANHGEGAPLKPLRLVLGDASLDALLSADGQARIAHVRAALAWADRKRDRLDLRVWVESTWERLGGPRAASTELALEDAERFLQLLEQAQAEDIGLDPEWLQRKVDQQFMSGGDASAPVQVMTLHKAKGLEFERVFIPRLNGEPRGNSGDLMLWDERTSEGQRTFLLAANDRSASSEPTLYNYLRAQRSEKNRLENVRLLYVGATRAIAHLHLSATVNWDERKDEPKTPPAASLLRTIWPSFAAGMQVHDSLSHLEEAAAIQPLVRLGADSLPQPVSTVHSTSAGDNRPERSDNHFDRAVGTIVHLALEQLSRRVPLPASASPADHARWRSALLAEGLWGEALERGLAAVDAAIAATLAEGGEGRWVLSNEHEVPRSEWRLSRMTEEGGAQDLIVDRTFVERDSGVRWIVDYKNSQPAPGEVWDAFTTREAAKYREQLERYRDTLRALGNQPIQCALFFTARGVLHTLPDLALEEREH